MRTKLVLVFLLVVCTSMVKAQDIDKIMVSRWYFGTLTKVLDDLSQEFNVKFDYDREKASKLTVDVPPFKRSLRQFIELMICDELKMKYFIDDFGVIFLRYRWESINESAVVKKRLYSGSAEKRNFVLSGRVYDRENKESLPYVNISVRGTQLGTSSNIDGYFTLLNVPSDTSAILISYIGYKPKLIHLDPSMPVSNLLIDIEQDAEQLSEVVVVAERQDVLQTNEKVGVIKMTPVKMNVLPSLGEKDIFRTFQLMPGVSAANENSSGLYVRGGTPDQSLVMFDGFTVYNVEHLFGFYSAFNSNAIKDIQLFRGGFDSKYGGRLSSVVEITGKEGNKVKLGGYADIGLLSANLALDGPLGKKATFIVAARRSWQSPIYNLIYENVTTQTLPQRPGGTSSGGMVPPGGDFKRRISTRAKSYFYDLNAKLTYNPSLKDVLTLSMYNGADNLDNSFNPRGPGDGSGLGTMSINNKDITDWGNLGASLKWSRKQNNRLYWALLLCYSGYFNDRDRSTTGSYTNSGGAAIKINEGTSEHNELSDLTAKLDVEYKINDNNHLLFGFNHTNNRIKYSYIQNDTGTIMSQHTTGNLASVYSNYRIEAFDKRLEITPGVRLTYYDLTNQFYAEPRLIGHYKIGDRWKIKGSAGLYNQFAKRVTREDVMQGDRYFWILSDGDKIPVSSSMQFVAGMAYETKDYLIDIEAYYKKLDNISQYSLRFNSPMHPYRPGEASGTADITYEDQYFTGNGYARGFDLLLQKKYGNLTGWIGYSLAEVMHNFPSFGDGWFYASNDVRHELKLVGTYKWRNWDFSATWIFASGKPYTQPEGFYSMNLPDGSVRDFFTVSQKNSLRLPTYHRLDLAATYNFRLWGLKSSIGLSLFNAYNRSNVWYKQFQIVDNEVIETDVNYLGIMPNATFSVKF